MGFFQRVRKYRTKCVCGLAVVLLLAVAFRVITERAFLAQASIQGAFAMLTPEKSQGIVTMTGRYQAPAYGFSREKLLQHFGDRIGLAVDGPFREVSYEGRKEYVYEKVAAEARSLLKLVYLTEPETYYICAEVTLTGKNAEEAAAFRNLMRSAAGELELYEVTTTLELCGVFDGEIPLAEKDAWTDRILAELYAQPVYENRENNSYTVYAYTGAVEEYMVVEKKKINVQVAFYYDRGNDCTEVVLASPLGLR